MQLCVSRGNSLFSGSHQRREVISVREADGLHRREDSNPCIPRKEQLRTGSRDTIRTFDDHWQHRETRVNRYAKCSLLERKEIRCVASGSFWEHNQRVSAFGSEFHAFVDCDSAGPSSFSIDFYDANPSHGDRHKRDAEQFLLRQEPSLDREKPKQQRDVVRREVIRDDHVTSVRVDVLDPFHAELHGRDAKEGPRPSFHNPSVKGRGRANQSVQDDERRVEESEHEEQGDEHKDSYSCDQRLQHVGSVDAMEKVTS